MRNALLYICFAVLMPMCTQAQITIGPAAGFRITNYTTRLNKLKLNTRKQEKEMLDLQAGAVADIPFSPRFHLQPGLLFTTNSYKYEGKLWDAKIYSEYYNIRSLELPVNLELHTGKSGKGHFFFSAGGFLAYNVSGRRHVKNGSISVPSPKGGAVGMISVEVPEIEEKLKYGNGKDADYRRMGAGATFNAGYQHKSGAFVRVHYQERLMNHYVYDKWGEQRLISNNYGLTIGYLISKKTLVKDEGRKP